MPEQRKHNNRMQKPESPPKRRVALGEAGKTVKRSVAECRRLRRMSIRDLSDKLTEIGHPMGYSTVSEIERGDRRVDVDDLVKLAEALDVDVLRLLGHGIVVDDDPLSDEALEIIDLVTALDRRLFRAELAAEPHEPDEDR